VSITGQAVIFSTRTHGLFFMSRPSWFLLVAFVVAQLVATFIACYANWPFTQLYGIGWQWSGTVWIYSFIWIVPMDLPKLLLRYIIQGKFTYSYLTTKALFAMDLNAASPHMMGSSRRRAPSSVAYAAGLSRSASRV